MAWLKRDLIYPNDLYLLPIIYYQLLQSNSVFLRPSFNNRSSEGSGRSPNIKTPKQVFSGMNNQIYKDTNC